MTEWDSYEDFDAALNQLYSDFMPVGLEDNWANALFANGEYNAWADYMADQHDWDIDMGEFWHDFREAYSATS
jgi:hypothetical protein